MSKICDICAKRPGSGNRRSHSMRATRRRYLPNLQSIRIVDRGKPVTLRACTRCIRTIGKTQKVRKPAAAKAA